MEWNHALTCHWLSVVKDEHVALLEQWPAADTLRQFQDVADERGVDLPVQEHCNQFFGIRFAHVDAKVRDDPRELREWFHEECGGNRGNQSNLERRDRSFLITLCLKANRLRGSEYPLQRGKNQFAQLSELGELPFAMDQ